MRKAQIVVLREIFTFALGLAVMITIAGFFAVTIAPEISEMSVQSQLESLTTHVSSLIGQTESVLINGFNTSLTFFAELPSFLGTSEYRVYIDNNSLCARTTSQFVLRNCLKIISNSTLSGNYLSGSELEINAFKNDSGSFISFKNKV